MSDTVPATETVPTEPLSNEGTPAATPVVNAADPAEVEKARKEAEQARMEANMLRNKLAEKDAAEAAAKAEQLKEKEEFKTLYEQTNAELERIRNEQAEKERAAALNGATEKVFGEYPANVVELARTAGLKLSDDSEEAVSALKEKLDVFKKQVAPGVSANNPPNTVPAEADRSELIQRVRSGDKTATSELINSIPAVQAWKEGAQKGIY